MNEKNSHLQSSENIFIIFILKFLCDIMASYSCFYLFPIKILFVCMRNYFHKKTLKKKIKFLEFHLHFYLQLDRDTFQGVVEERAKKVKKGIRRRNWREFLWLEGCLKRIKLRTYTLLYIVVEKLLCCHKEFIAFFSCVKALNRP